MYRLVIVLIVVPFLMFSLLLTFTYNVKAWSGDPNTWPEGVTGNPQTWPGYPPYNDGFMKNEA